MKHEVDWMEPGVRAFVDKDAGMHKWETDYFLSYLTLGYADPTGERGIDRFRRSQGHLLRHPEQEALTALATAWTSLFEVLVVHLDQGLEVVDTVSEDSFFIQEHRATHYLKEGALFFGWLTPYYNSYELVGGSISVSPAHEDLMLETLFDEMEKARAEHPDKSDKELFQIRVPTLIRTLRHAVENWAPVLHTPDGQAVEKFRKVYAINERDAQTVSDKLEQSAEINRVKEGSYVWRQGGAHNDEQLSTLAFINVRTVRLEVTTMTKNAMTMCERFLHAKLGKKIQHRSEEQISFKDIMEERWREHTGYAEETDPYREFPTIKQLEQTRRLESRQTPRPSKSNRRRLADGEVVLPRLAHETMKKLVPGVYRVAKRAATEERARWTDETGTLDPETLINLDYVNEFLFAFGNEIHNGPRKLPEDACRKEADLLFSHLFNMANFELHRRKVFWVDESLAWMLRQTDLDVPGQLIQLPFPAFVLAFTDHETLDLSLPLLRDVRPVDEERTIHLITLYVVLGAEGDDGREYRFTFLFDAFDGQWPYLLSRSLWVRPQDRLDEVLDSHCPDVDAERLDPVFKAPELKKLLHLAINSILYTTCALLDPITLPPRQVKKTRATGNTGSSTPCNESSEEVYYLPGKIPISRIRQLKQLDAEEQVQGLMKRFMVRGHWRRAPTQWRDQRLRWIEPYWKGPDIGNIIEKEYKLKL